MRNKKLSIAVAIGLIIAAALLVFIFVSNRPQAVQDSYVFDLAEDDMFEAEAEAAAAETDEDIPAAVYEPSDEENELYEEDILPVDAVEFPNDTISWLIEPMWDFDAVFNFRGGMAGVEYFEDGNWESTHILGYVNNRGEIVIPLEHRHAPAMYSYRGAPPFSEGLVAIHSADHDAVGIFDTYGNLVVPFYYDWAWAFSEGLVAVRQGGWEETDEGWVDTGRWGFINSTGEVVIPIQFEYAADFSEGLAPVMQDGYWGYINTSGEVVIPFTKTVARDEARGDPLVPRFSEGLAPISTGDWEPDEDGRWINNIRWGFIDQTGNMAIPFIYNAVSIFSEGLAAVMGGDWQTGVYWGFVDSAGNEVVAPVYEWVSHFSYGRAIVRDQDWRTMGVIDRQGNYIVPFGRYRTIRQFSQGLAAVDGGYWDEDGEFVSRGWGFIDVYGKEVIPFTYDLAGEFFEGFAAVGIDAVGRIGEGQRFDSGRWGFIDREGNVVVPIIFDEVRDFSEGIAWVRQGDLWGLLQVNE
ncbi:MAG: WG repeat-containing protein, partial [Defluviitaleaceae bacterium]|nr:WG repeat-containing protein [Defluviitaleaceae bacterium]